jgi:hypothetical protein
VIFSDRLQLVFVISDALRQRADRLQDGLKGWPECLRQMLGDFVVEAPCRTLGQAMTEGFDRSPNVIDQLRAATD